MSAYSHRKSEWQKLLSPFYSWSDRSLFIHSANKYFGEIIRGLEQETKPQSPFLSKVTFCGAGQRQTANSYVTGSNKDDEEK